MKNYIYLILVALSFYFTTANATDKYNIQTQYQYVVAKSGLNFRKEPKGEIVGKLNFGDKVAVIEHSNIFETIKDDNTSIKGEWVGLQIGNTTVYVFDAYLSFQNPQIYEILSPVSYYGSFANTSILENPADFININWIDLHKKDQQYFLGKAIYSIQSGIDPCHVATYKTIIPNNDTLIYINNKDLQLGEIKSLSIEKETIWPDEESSFGYNNDKYTLQAEGDILSRTTTYDLGGSTHKSIHKHIENYELYLSINNQQRSILLEQNEYDLVKLLFAGDIDSDGTLDFIFETNSHDEDRVLLYLSSTADEDKNYHISETLIRSGC